MAEHLRRNTAAEVTALDLAALNATWKTAGDVFVSGGFDVVLVANDFDAVDTFSRTVQYVRTLSPRSKIGTFGRLSAMLPEFFQRFDIDFIAGNGDHEIFAADVVAALSGEAGATRHLWSRDSSGGWLHPVPTARYLTAAELPLPHVGQLPYPAYDLMYADDSARFCGVPQRRELVVPVARGCPVGCDFCDVPGREGLRERRVSVERVVDYIVSSREVVDFEYISMYAPTFTLNRRWVRDFCAAYRQLPQRLPWKCTTTIYHMNDELAVVMADAGCVRISVGLETLEIDAQEQLPLAKHVEQERFTSFAESCRRNGIEVNCFVILGLPGTTLAGVKRTKEVAESLGARVRPTVYTDYSAMRVDMSVSEIASFNRHLLGYDVPEAEALGLYQVLFDPAARPTDVMERIPRRARHAQI